MYDHNRKKIICIDHQHRIGNELHLDVRWETMRLETSDQSPCLHMQQTLKDYHCLKYHTLFVPHLKEDMLIPFLRHGFIGKWPVNLHNCRIHNIDLALYCPSQKRDVIMVKKSCCQVHNRPFITQEPMVSRTNAFFEKEAMCSRMQEEIRSRTWTSLSQAQGSIEEPALTKMM